MCANFTVNSVLDKQINDRYEQATQKYQTVEVLSDDVCKQVEASIEDTMAKIAKVKTQIELLNELRNSH